jgi:hypothetical protein
MSTEKQPDRLDSAKLSLIRGRLQAALQAVLIALLAAKAFWSQVEPLLADGVTLEEAQQILAHATVTLDAWSAAYIAAAAGVIAVISLFSKKRETKRAHAQGGANGP